MHSKVKEASTAQSSGDERQTTVLFAEVRGPQVPEYLQALGAAAELSGGRVLHKRANGLLALFSSANAAAAAAARMHIYAQTLPPSPERTGLRIGFHEGPVAQRGDDIFGDTVNLAVKVADQAKDGQVLVTGETASTLKPALQDLVRTSGGVPVQGGMLVGELVWRDALSAIATSREPDSREVLEVSCGRNKVVRRRKGDSVLIGRDPDCDLVIEGAQVSRRHCTIVRRGALLVLHDASSNGTFITTDSQPEVCVHGTERALGKSGSISFGQPAAAGGSVAKYLYS